MNFVELVHDLRVEAAASGRKVTSVQGDLVGELERLRMWVRDAWTEIQNRQRWLFLFVESTCPVPLNASILNPSEYAAGEVAEWIASSFRIADDGQPRFNSTELTYVDYPIWRDNEGFNLSTPGIPTAFTIHPNTEAIHLAPASNAPRELFYDYWRTPQVLTEDGDVPIMPARYHKLIVYWALRKYGLHESAPEVIARVNTELGGVYQSLLRDQLPRQMTQGLYDGAC